ncbi:hypothetical protein BBBOND_0312460 [Babesia bigemina]|uniref:Uncharacterized protein n=1 Tax=Babesia bigemina TaxID=5866 RepID=A0A061DA05_BABBI|nr:hypothetical protein BBBOND_0312460 [Babesia bigemina]CDR97343.1 hypothetical protein BBBOND_0312460 [Babesia bigemina]|eukprot:XP_012769529.1 hypothetical protein BBBOND_0312460 [Babesia bigemina]
MESDKARQPCWSEKAEQEIAELVERPNAEDDHDADDDDDEGDGGDEVRSGGGGSSHLTAQVIGHQRNQGYLAYEEIADVAAHREAEDAQVEQDDGDDDGNDDGGDGGVGRGGRTDGRNGRRKNRGFAEFRLIFTFLQTTFTSTFVLVAFTFGWTIESSALVKFLASLAHPDKP